ncbi:TonB-dependent receptor domain-containing protein [Glaesserella sp.]|uniref:TonB-dependent receptor plug domain-containing protein n=1 Tax=Glaesserella sp. TaxID=2094731 RepID=UPI0035A06506
MKRNLVTTLVFTLTPFAIAQTEQATELPPLNVYSAYAAPVNQDKTASSVTVLTEKEFTERNATYVSDVLKTVPSIAISSSGGRGTLTNFYLRGADANHTAVIIDGVKMNPISGYGFDFGGLSLSNIERIEVLRGEQSALWGSDAMGGVIYITTKSGLYKEKPFNVDVDFGIGSHNTVDSSATISGYNNGFYYALHGDSHYTRGISAYSKDTFRYTALDGSNITTGGATEKDKFHRDNVSAKVGYSAEDKGIEVLAGRYSQVVRYDDTYGRSETVFDDRIRTRENVFKLSGYFGSDRELFKHKASISSVKTDSYTSTIAQNWLTGGFDFSPSHNDAGKLNANYQLDVNFDREGTVTQAVSLLGEYQKANYKSDSSYANFDKDLTEKSVAAEYRLFTENDHSLSLSGRYIDNSEYKNTVTGRIAGAYRLSPNFRIHTSFGTAIQNPTITEYFGYNGSFLANPNLKPEKSLGGDFGLLVESKDKNHSVDVTYFARNVEDLISSETVDFTTYRSRAINLEGKSKIKGVEIAYNGKLTEDLTAYANYTYTRAKDSQELELVRRPKHMANLGLAYQITEKLGSSVNISYVGQRIDSYYNSITYSSLRVRLPSYTLVGLGVNYQITKDWNLYANLNNLFDKQYENIIGYGQDGRNVYVGLKGSF